MSGSQAVYEAVGNRKVALEDRSDLKVVELNVPFRAVPLAKI